MRFIMGLDLSLRGTGIVILPLDWVVRSAPKSDVLSWRFDGGELSKKATERAKADRDLQIANFVLRTALKHAVKDVFIEDYAFSRNKTGATDTREMGGVVRHILITSIPDVEIERVVASQARKHLFGAIKRTVKIKEHVAQGIAAMGLDIPTEDERDALVIANYGLALCGQRSLAVPQ